MFANSLRVINYQDEAVEKTDIFILNKKKNWVADQLGGQIKICLNQY